MTSSHEFLLIDCGIAIRIGGLEVGHVGFGLRLAQSRSRSTSLLPDMGALVLR